MKLSMIGTGYVGLITGSLFADRGNNVTCVDVNQELIESLQQGKIHIFEPGLEQIVSRNIQNGNLQFSTSTQETVESSDITFLAVNTPSNPSGSFNLDYLTQAARDVGEALKTTSGFKVVVGKSTVPQGTHKILTKVINETSGGADWAYVANPETLAEGNAVQDFSKPERIILGTDSEKAFALMKELYHPFNIQQDRIVRGSPADAELAKLFSNTALAMKVAMVNEFARISDTVSGADMDTIRRMVCEDSRIGYQFMFPSPGYGGSCFPKDVQGLVSKAREHGYDPLLLGQVHESNQAQKMYVGNKINSLLQRENPTVAVWGVTFKPGTDDMREAASIPIVTGLLNRGAKITIYDPQDEKAKEIFGEKVTFVNHKYEAVQDADALILLTEWREFDSPDFDNLSSHMRGRQLFDLRNRWLPEAVNRNGFDYIGIGRNHPCN